MNLGGTCRDSLGRLIFTVEHSAVERSVVFALVVRAVPPPPLQCTLVRDLALAGTNGRKGTSHLTPRLIGAQGWEAESTGRHNIVPCASTLAYKGG